MMMMLCKRGRRFLRSTDGSASVEFALLVPAFLGMVLFAADTATSFTRQSNIWNISQQTARIVARHGLDPEAAALFAQGQLRFSGHTPEVVITVDEQHQQVTVVVTAESMALAPFGFLSRTMADTVSVSVSQALEPI